MLLLLKDQSKATVSGDRRMGCNELVPDFFAFFVKSNTSTSGGDGDTG
jgi:hypothetical protein